MKHMPSARREEMIQRLLRSLPPEQSILCGSPAYGQPSEASDLDLLVRVADSDEPRHRRARAACQGPRGLMLPTAVLRCTHGKIAQAAAVPTSCVSQAAHPGRGLDEAKRRELRQWLIQSQRAAVRRLSITTGVCQLSRRQRLPRLSGTAHGRSAVLSTSRRLRTLAPHHGL